ncbi:MAG: 4Fe-4S dicluster domain-containing protein [Chloroflexi bacterium]|nr:4Fe-4S dicluster domain-containing protein [Chloroflexota bacterium]
MSFVEEVAATPGGAGIRACIQCGVCSGSCPMADHMEYPPRKMIAMIRAGLRDEVLSSNAPWHCLSCYMCTVRCPRGVKPTELAHALESLATEHGYRVKDTRTPAMYRSFVQSIRGNGRVHEFGMMFRYFLSTSPMAAIKMTPLAIKLFLRQRMPLVPRHTKGKEDLARIIARFREVRGNP